MVTQIFRISLTILDSGWFITVPIVMFRNIFRWVELK